MSEKTVVGGIPIECLTGERAAVWSGWRKLGDRELVREASAKGTHINLAYKFLASRRNWTIEDARQYFDKEVEIWVSELLGKHQVYRASHILKNVGKDPVEYIFEVCTRCKDSSLRSYLAEYLINVARFEDEYTESWNIIKSITQFEQKYAIQDGLSSSISIEDIKKLPENTKHALCTELYFSMTGQDILPNITNTMVWDYLLSNNQMDKIRFWIDTHYDGNQTEEEIGLSEKYKSLFRTLDITEDMLEFIDSSNANILVKDLTKNHLCRYGVFVKKERKNVKSMLARIFGSAIAPNQFATIVSRKSCNVDKTEYFKNLDKQLCIANCFPETGPREEESKVADLYDILTKMCANQEQYQDALMEGILDTIRYISDDVNKFLRQNYVIVLALIFLHLSKVQEKTCGETESVVINENRLREVFQSGADLKFGNYSISHEILQHTLVRIPLLERIIQNKIKLAEVTMYELLDGYKNLNVKQLFKWRWRNEVMPNFSNECLVRKYGHIETLTYGYYLKEARPNMAIQSLKQSRGKRLGSVSPRRKSKAGIYAHILALRNLDKPEIICCCISFIEMLAIDSENLRLHVTVARYVQSQINVSIGNLLVGVMYRNKNDLRSVMSYLESSFEKSLNENLSGDSQKLVEAFKVWGNIVRFARAHETTLPDSFLKFLAKRNHWVEFVLLCHIFSYPLEQVLENAKEFEDSVIREHLMPCLNNTQLGKSHLAIHGEQKLRSRDARQSLYEKIGVEQIGSGSPTSIGASSSDSYASACEYHPISENTCSPEDDLWLTILKCHQSPDPPGALINASQLTMRPILTILATCYEPSSVAAYCYSWMVVTAADENILADYKQCLEHQIWSANQVLNLLDVMVSSGYIGTISKAYKIFMPESCFDPFFEFLAQCVNHGDFTNCQQRLLDFKSRCSTLKCNKVMDWDCSDITYLQNLYWVTIVVVKCVISTLAYDLQSTHLQIKFLDILNKSDFHVNLPVDAPDFSRLLQITRILQKTNVVLDFKAFTLSNNVYNFDAEIRRCINDLLKIKDYDNCLKLSNIAGLNSSKIILAKCRNEFKQRVKKNDKIGNEFWNDCANSFEKYNVLGERAAEFFVEHAEKAVSDKERYEILKLAFETLKNVNTEQQTIDTLEMAMWKYCILAGPENIQLDIGNYVFNQLKTELLSGLNNIRVTYTLTDPRERDATGILIDKLIDYGKLDTALRISTIFNYKHKDLQILMLCLSLAEGEINPSELTAEQRIILARTNKSKQQKYGLKNRGLRRFSSSAELNAGSLCSIGEGEGETDRTKDEKIRRMQTECLSVLEKVLEILQHGVDVCLRIVACYKLAVRLRKSYQILLTLNDPIQFLHEVAESNIDNKTEIISDIITAYKISAEDTATFLAENIAVNITRAIEGGAEDYICLWRYPLNTSFHMIMELCPDVSLLGWQLLKTAKILLGHSNFQFNFNFKHSPILSCHIVSTLKTIVELLIRSHDCFTASCNMEGIASVLRKCQHLANSLQNLKYWTLLVRLVTGVGRFTEMNYVFQILQENDQFEFLLGKGLDKVVGLKTALLEFLKRHCPENKELFTLVALHFRLYHEIASMWENEAKDVIKALIADTTKEHGRLPTAIQHEVKLTRTENVQKQLQLAVTNYTHAMQNYLQDKKLNLASRCSDQTQLVNLQLSLLGTVPLNHQVVCVINLRNDEIDKILCRVLNFSQALIVMQAYNHHVDWANLIYDHCILNGETKYFKDFTAVNKLTPSLVQDCARRYRLEKSITHTMADNMKTLVSEVSDVECKYALASQLGFKSIVESMLSNPMIGAYLKDTVWRKGYNAS